MTGPLLVRRRSGRPQGHALVWLMLLALGACSSPSPSDVDTDQSAGASAAPEGGRSSPRAARDAALAEQGEDAGARADAGARDARAAADLDGAGSDTPASTDHDPGEDAAAAGRPADASGSEGASDAGAPGFVLTPVGFPTYQGELTFPAAANPPTNASPEFTWSGVPANTKSLALVFRDLGNGAVKWVLWDIPPTLTGVPPGISPVAMPAEVPGSSQLGSLDNQGYAGPGSGARQYDFKLWALDVARLPVTARLTTLQIHDEVLPAHALATTAPVLLRNTRNLP